MNQLALIVCLVGLQEFYSRN